MPETLLTTFISAPNLKGRTLFYCSSGKYYIFSTCRGEGGCPWPEAEIIKLRSWMWRGPG